MQITKIIIATFIMISIIMERRSNLIINIFSIISEMIFGVTTKNNTFLSGNFF